MFYVNDKVVQSWIKDSFYYAEITLTDNMHDIVIRVTSPDKCKVTVFECDIDDNLNYRNITKRHITGKNNYAGFLMKLRYNSFYKVA